MLEERFWENKPLAAMSHEEWEALCDGCGRCCLVKLEDEDTGVVHDTSVVCRLFDHTTCRCTRYARRHVEVPDCIHIDADSVGDLGWLPQTCAYRLLDEGQPLQWWHPLVAGDEQAIRRAGISVFGNVVSETDVHPDDLQHHVMKWT